MLQNEYSIKTEKTAAPRRENKKTSHLDEEITIKNTKEKLNFCKIHLFK